MPPIPIVEFVDGPLDGQERVIGSLATWPCYWASRGDTREDAPLFELRPTMDGVGCYVHATIKRWVVLQTAGTASVQKAVVVDVMRWADMDDVPLTAEDQTP